ncbi:MAG: hypothetical protein Q8R54_00180, partial [Methylobacter sp.]|nr:hypothetical protein [Methylobacter sp.]
MTQALVVCGPEGIGKTTLLDVLQKRKTEAWRYCLIQGNADLSFEVVHRQLTLCIKADAPVKSLSTAYKQYENQHKQIVLIVDNAGELVPGLIAAIIQYAAANPVLRVVFALTHDELQVKRGSDRAVDDCHIIEIPPLSDKQCGDFLQDLSTKPYANLSFTAIGENMIAHIYRDTHGVPGRIIAEVSGVSGAKPSGKLKWILVFAVAAAIAIAIGVQWLISSTKTPGNVLPPDPTPMDGGHAVRQPEAVAVMQPPAIALPPASIELSKNNDKEAIAPVAVEKETDTLATPSAAIRQQQPVLAPSVVEVPTNEAKNALVELPVEVNTQQVDQKSVASVTKSDAASPIAIKPHAENKPSDGAQQKITEPPSPENLKNKALSEPVSADQVEQKPNNKQSVVAQQKVIEPLGASQEKPKQAELTSTVNDVKPPIPENPANKAQPEPMKAARTDNKQQPVAALQKIAEQLDASQEKPKPAELSKTINSVEPFTPNKLSAAPIAQTPAEVAAAPKEPTIEPTTPQQAEPSRIGSQPIATLPPPRDGGSAANGLEPLPPPSLAVGRTGSLPVATLPTPRDGGSAAN